jgi:hypothetical protein
MKNEKVLVFCVLNVWVGESFGGMRKSFNWYKRRDLFSKLYLLYFNENNCYFLVKDFSSTKYNGIIEKFFYLIIDD